MFTKWRVVALLLLGLVAAGIVWCGFCSKGEFGSRSNFSYEPFRYHDMNYVSFSEMLTRSQALAQKTISLFGYCARVSRADKQMFVFSSKESADRINMREGVALVNGINAGASAKSDSEFETLQEKYNNRFCEVVGRFSMDSVSIFPSDVDKGIPSHGSIEVFSMSGGMAREEEDK